MPHQNKDIFRVLTFVFLALEEELGVVEQVLAVLDGHLMRALVQLVEVELAIVAHPADLVPVVEQLQKFLRLLLSLLGQLLRLDLVGADQARLDLVLEALGLRSDIVLQEEEQEVWVQVGSQLLQLDGSV